MNRFLSFFSRFNFKGLSGLNKSYTVLLVPQDGTEMKTKTLQSDQLRRGLGIFAAVTVCLTATVTIMGVTAYSSAQERKELAEFRKIKHQQEQQLNQLKSMTESVQKEMAVLAKLEGQVKDQMRKSGMDVPEMTAKEKDAIAGKGGPSATSISELKVLMEQNKNIQKEISARHGQWNTMLDNIKAENYRKEVTPSLWPTDSTWVSSSFGSRRNPFDGYSADYHPGIDIAANYGEPIYATASGYVEHAGWYYGYGKYVRLNHDYGYESCYGHMSSIAVSSGTYVKKGQVIGYVGSTGYSTGPHLHFEVKRYGEDIDPQSLVK